MKKIISLILIALMLASAGFFQWKMERGILKPAAYRPSPPEGSEAATR